ncbi:MAG: hypothetical protein LBD90_01495, partial [Bifidobacteriaceae bacterium]|nr:hypothetical protein [Bifidobacteriaceae bacterium]
MASKEIWIVATDRLAGAEQAAARARGLAVKAVAWGTEPLPGADLTLVAPPPGAGELVETAAAPLAAWLRERGAEVVVFGAGQTGRSLAGQVGALLGASPKTISGV